VSNNPPRDSIFIADTIYTVAVKFAGVVNSLGKFAVLISQDAQGPAISFAAGGLRFTNNSILPRKPEVYVNLMDLGGIDRGAGKFTLTLDGDTVSEAEMVWSDTLESGGSMSVMIRPDFEPGVHTIYASATDNSGNSGTAMANFEVRGEFGISWAINYPNPFKTATTISYLLTDVTSDYVEVKIYTVSGRHIRTLRELDRVVANYRSLVWDGLDEKGDAVANGVYFARVKAKQHDQEVEKIIKLAKVR
jgi:subtilisin family serine protease